MDDIERRGNAWGKAIHAEGTRYVFERRSKWLRRKTIARDFVGLAVPVCLAYLLGSEVFAPLKPYKDYGVGALGIAAVAQTLMVLWSLLSHWDDELAYCIHSGRDSYLLKEAWKKIGQGDAKNIEIEYDLLSAEQAIADSRDIEKGISDSEKQVGMRSGLIEFQRKCICGEFPKSRHRPWLKNKSCVVCGGN